MADWLADEVAECRDCRDQGDGVVVLCGWHESLAVAVRVVEVTAGTLVREGDPLPVRLRQYADRAARCWEGSDADGAIAAMLEAADLLDAQGEYDGSPELRDLLGRAAEAETRGRSDLLDGDR